jgi:hypothetical protein
VFRRDGVDKDGPARQGLRHVLGHAHVRVQNKPVQRRKPPLPFEPRGGRRGNLPEDDVVAVPGQVIGKGGAPTAGAQNRDFFLHKDLGAPFLKPNNGGSSPRANRFILGMCRRTTTKHNATAMASRAGEAPANHAARGKTTAPAKDPTDTRRETAKANAKTSKATPMGPGSNARKTPADVATPFPPRNRTHGDQVWPATAASAREQRARPRSGKPAQRAPDGQKAF